MHTCLLAGLFLDPEEGGSPNATLVLLLLLVVISSLTSCGAGHNKPRPLLPPMQLTC